MELWWSKRARRPNAWSRTTAGARQEVALSAAARCSRRQPQWLPALPAPQCAPWRRRLSAEALWRATWHRRAFAAAIRTGAVEALEKLDCGSLSRCQQGRYNRAVGCRDARGRGSVEAKLLQLLGALENARQKNRASAAGSPCWVDCRKPHDGFVDWFLANLADQPMGWRLCFQLLLALKRFDRIERRRALQKPAKRG